MKIAMVVPTVREEQAKQFRKEWLPLIEKQEDCVLYFVEDNPEVSFDISGKHIVHFSWRNIEVDLGKEAWIIPRRTDCVRSYGFWQAWKRGADVIISIDDDCYPEAKHGDRFFEEHLERLFTDASQWESTMPFRVRGMPYREMGLQEVVMNHGVWSNIPDLDAVTHLARYDLRTSPVRSSKMMRSWFPMCGMNVAFKRAITPYIYFGLQGQDWPYDRYGDIWCGLFAQKIIRHLGYAIRSGRPSVHHAKASNVFENIRKEATGYMVNEELWKVIASIELTTCHPIDSFKELCAKCYMKGEYWSKLKEAQKTWISLFEEGKT